MCILYVAVPYTHLIRLLHRLIFSAGRKFHCPFSHKVFVAPPFPAQRSSAGNWVTFVANPLSSRAAQLFPLTFYIYFISFFGFSTYPTDISKFALQIIFIFISRLFQHIFPQVFLLLFHRFSQAHLPVSPHCHFPRYMHHISYLSVCGVKCQEQLVMWPKLSTDLVSPLSPSLSLALSIIYLQYFLIQNEAASHSELLMAKHATQVQRSCLCLPSPLLGPHPFGRSHFQLQFYPQLNRNPFPLAILQLSLLPSPSSFLLLSFAIFACSPLSCLLPFLTRGRQKVLDSIYKICLLPLLFLFLFTLLSFSFHFSFYSPAFHDYFCIICQSKIINFQVMQTARAEGSVKFIRRSDCSQLESHWQCTV